MTSLATSPRATHTTAVADLQLAAWRAFLEAHASTIQQLARELQERASLPLTWYDVLLQLHEAPDHRMRMRELAQAVLISKSGLTRLVDRMEQEGLVTRAECDSDRRGTYTELTEQGLATLRRSAPTHLAGVAEHFAQHVDDDEARVMVRALRRVADAAPAR